jgi:hypothetical protein
MRACKYLKLEQKHARRGPCKDAKELCCRLQSDTVVVSTFMLNCLSACGKRTPIFHERKVHRSSIWTVRSRRVLFLRTIENDDEYSEDERSSLHPPLFKGEVRTSSKKKPGKPRKTLLQEIVCLNQKI